MNLKDYIHKVMTQIDTITNSVTFTVGLDERAKVLPNSPSTVMFTIESTPMQEFDAKEIEKKLGLL